MTAQRSLGLFVRETGSISAPAIVFLHGATVSSRMWEPQLAALDGYHCIAPDLPEHGLSGDIGPFELEDAARRVAAIIAERVPTGRAHVVGLSMGGAVALTLLRMAPERVDHLMISGTPAGLGRLEGALLVATGIMYALMPDAIIDANLRQMEVPDRYRESLRQDMRKTVTPELNSRLAHALMDLKLPQVATVPLLVAVGEREAPPLKDGARGVVAAIRGSRGVLVPRMGHIWNLQDPDLFTATVQAWIADSPLPLSLLPLQASG